jgi:hypothetical protein
MPAGVHHNEYRRPFVCGFLICVSAAQSRSEYATVTSEKRASLTTSPLDLEKRYDIYHCIQNEERLYENVKLVGFRSILKESENLPALDACLDLLFQNAHFENGDSPALGAWYKTHVQVFQKLV